MLAAFDLDNTLVDRSAAVRRWARLFVGREGLPAEAVGAIVAADRDGSTPRARFLAAVAALPGVRLTGPELRAWYDVSYPSCYGVEEESIQALTRLRDAGWKVGVVTNGPAAGTAAKLARSGLAPLVDAVCVAEEVGIRKPDRGIFDEVARRCGTALTGWMVGDAPVEDIDGGAGAGLRTAWLRRGRCWEGDGARPDIEVDSVREAVTAILTSVDHVTAR